MRAYVKIPLALLVLGLFTITAQVGNVHSEEISQKLFIKPGGSRILEIQNVSKDIRVLVSESDIVHARPLKENQVYIRGKKTGYCTVTIWDNISKKITSEIDVTVSYDLSGLKKQMATHFPNQDINVYGADDGIVLSGTVSGPEIVEQAIRLAERFIPTENSTSMVHGGEGGISYSEEAGSDESSSDGGDISATGRTEIKISKITNLLNVDSIHQVLLEVKIAEVNRDSTMNWSAGVSFHKLGSDFGGVIGGSPTLPDGSPFIPGGSHYPDVSNIDGGSIITDFVGNAANVLLKIDNVNLALEFLEGEGLANTLAEPRLVALSGQEASFLAGGKFPYISNTSTTDGGTTNSSVEFEEFGVSLKFTPIVQSNGLITLRVAPTISDITGTIPSGNGLLPLVDTRELETTAQLHDGQTLVLAGLLREDMTNTVNKVPFLGDLPILGALFRSQAYIKKKSDLMITITPHLASPVKEGLVSFPGEFIKDPNRLEFYLMGRLEGARHPNDSSRVSGHNFSLSNSEGLEGSFGHLEQ